MLCSSQMHTSRRSKYTKIVGSAQLFELGIKEKNVTNRKRRFPTTITELESQLEYAAIFLQAQKRPATREQAIYKKFEYTLQYN